jgi:hypothetical protein
MPLTLPAVWGRSKNPVSAAREKRPESKSGRTAFFDHQAASLFAVC